MKFKCRTVKPQESKWYEVEAATAEQAANDFHLDHFDVLPRIGYRLEDDDGPYLVYFARVEIEGHGSMISRIYQYGIWRRGGVKPRNPPRLEDIARELDYRDDPKTLIEPGWQYEESIEEARARR